MNYNTTQSPFNTYNITLFQPNQISNLALWLDGADSNSVILSNSDVIQWNDKSGNNNNAVSGSGIITYASNSMIFAGNQVFYTPLTSVLNNQSGFAIVSYNSSGVLDIISVSAASGNPGVQQIIAGDQQLIQIYGGGYTTSGAYLTQNTIFMYEYSFSSSNINIYLNGTQTGSNSGSFSVSGTGTVNIGAYNTSGEAFGGQIYEIILFSNVLTTIQQQQIESYLAYKYNLVSFLPTNHPYAYNPYYAYGPYNNTPFRYGPFISPSNISGLNLWLDAADYSTLNIIGGEVISWNDKSGFSNNFSNNFSNIPPYYNSNLLNGLPTISFSRFSSNSFSALDNSNFTFTGTISLTYFFVAQRNSNDTNFQRFFSAYGTDGNDNDTVGVFDVNTSIDNGSIVFERNSVNISVAYDSTSQPFIGTLVINDINNNDTIFINSNLLIGGVNGYELSNLNLTFIRFGAAVQTNASNDNGHEALQGNMSELLLYNRALNSNEIPQVQNYLANKWNIYSILPPIIYNPTLLHDNIGENSNNFPLTITQQPIIQNKFTPITLSNCILWLDANNQILFDKSGYLLAWYDKSGNNDTINITSSSWSLSTPLNNKQTILYNSGVAIEASLPLSIGLNDYTFIAVWIPTNVYVNIALSIGVTDTGAVGLGYNTPNGGYNFFDWGGVEIDASYPTSQFIIQIGIRNSLTNIYKWHDSRNTSGIFRKYNRSFRIYWRCYRWYISY